MKVSILTVCYNSAKTIEQTINSVLSQTYSNIEYIIVDGVSTDETMEVVERYKSSLASIVSEPDSGLYDAMNKAISLASGDIVGILNSDDFFNDNTVIERIVAEFEAKAVDAVFGDLVYVDPVDTSKTVRSWKSGSHEAGAFQRGWSPAHPTLYLKKSVYDKYGVFDLSMGSAADYEFTLRIFEKYKISSAYIPYLFVKMRAGGVSNRSLKNVWLAHKNIIKAFNKNDIAINEFFHTVQRVGPKIMDAFIFKFKNLFS